jgi:hypothetical protein
MSHQDVPNERQRGSRGGHILGSAGAAPAERGLGAAAEPLFQTKAAAVAGAISPPVRDPERNTISNETPTLSSSHGGSVDRRFTRAGLVARSALE